MSILNNIVVTDIKQVLTVASQRGKTEKITDRQFYGLSFCKEGQITYTHNGKSFVSDKNHAIILPQGQTYTLHRDKTGAFPLINFSTMNFLCNTFIVIPIKNAESYIKDYEQLKSLSLFEKSRTKKMSVFYNIISRLENELISYNNTLLPAISYIKDNFSDTLLTNSVLAEKCNISEVYFRKLFLTQYKVTPKQYIIDLRIAKAKQLLTDGNLKIGAISESCGFSNQYHFCRVFKEKTGLTPTEYMKQNRIHKL